MTEAQQRTALVEAARSWLNTPYHHKARVKGAGVDCAQLLIGVYADAGLIKAFDTGDYPPDWMLHREEERFLAWVERYLVEVESPLPGDVAIWRFGRSFSHGAIVVAWPQFIHAYRVAGCVCLGQLDQDIDLMRRSIKFYSFFQG
ncbi:C40 family peptidase [Ferriphaselus sp. R-1]|uniref:C40 family peptidase n=1 Tax=Ferriphaselus sp. R-1 TaxID=1485544 RepID=UPI00054E7C85|nr:C40 family peptidase [Ferriphaselus sp. R-1]